MTAAARRAAEAGSRISKRPRERRWGSRFSSAAANAEGEAPRSIRRRKWWGPTVLEAVSAVRHNGKSVRDVSPRRDAAARRSGVRTDGSARHRSEEHTSELQSLMRHSYAVFCLKKKND